jgi:hypothetical protein
VAEEATMSRTDHHYAGCRIVIDSTPIGAFWMSTWIVESLLLAGETELEKDQHDAEQQALCDACQAIDTLDRSADWRR